MAAVAAGDKKSIHALKFNIFMGHDLTASILGSYSIPGILFSKNTRIPPEYL
jgi:hypothetical protein